MDDRPIGIFDSGVGGLSVLLEVQKLLPNESFIYLGDQVYAPYGSKTKEELVRRVGKIMDFFIKQDVKAVIIACNTATVCTIDETRKHFQIPIIGTVPVVKTLAKITKSGKTAVFSTPATAKSKYINDLIKKFAPNITVLKIGGTGLEELVDKGIIEGKEIEGVLNLNLKPLVNNGVDAIALGCTHYPFLSEKIQEIVGPKVFVVDSGAAIARRTREILRNNGSLANEKGENRYYTTGKAEKFRSVAEKLMNQKLERVEQIHIF